MSAFRGSFLADVVRYLVERRKPFLAPLLLVLALLALLAIGLEIQALIPFIYSIF